MSKVYGYIRVSTVEQNLARQEESLAKWEEYKGVKIDLTFSEKVSAKDTNRERLELLLQVVGAGDTIVVHSFDRLARSTKDLLNIVDDLIERGVMLVSVKDDFDLSTAQGKLMFTMLGAIAEFERQNMLERQKEGIAIAKSEGKYKGRKKIKKPDNWDEIYLQWKNREITGKAAMEALNVKRNTFYNFVKEEEGEK